MIKVIAILCKLSDPTACHDELVTTDQFSGVSLVGCQVGLPQLAAWMAQHPGYRLAGWRCVVGQKEERA